MNKYKYIVNISYNGARYNGYATQPNRNTIQDILEDILTKLNSNYKVKTFATSRTDAKVHAKDQYVQFFMDKEFDLITFKEKLNKLLPMDICIENIFKDFDDKINVRYDVKSKTYRYLIMLRKNPFLFDCAYLIDYRLNIEKMQNASEIFVGTHDFTAVSNANTSVLDKVRTINYLKITEVEISKTPCIEITINANGYLYNMVRIIVGCLIEVGKNKISILELESILKNKKRTEHCVCVPAQGLVLEKTKFKDVL